MTVTHSLEGLIKKHYPEAMTEVAFIERVWQVLDDEYHIDLSNVLLANSLCADDVIPVLESEMPLPKVQGKLNKHFLGPFSMGGLAGIPYSGLTGVLTVAHHIPDGGSALIAYGPHIGITDQGELGKLLRPGQHKESAACGALTLALKHFQSSSDYRPAYDDDDTEQMTLERRLLPFREQILTAEKPLQAATEIAYTIIHELIHRYVRTQKKEFSCEYLALAGGIVINTSPQTEDYVDLKHLSVVRVSEI
ncbi:MAG: hypothetical protein ACRERU_16465 [Methylococcales bacterium]